MEEEVLVVRSCGIDMICCGGEAMVGGVGEGGGGMNLFGRPRPRRVEGFTAIGAAGGGEDFSTAIGGAGVVVAERKVCSTAIGAALVLLRWPRPSGGASVLRTGVQPVYVMAEPFSEGESVKSTRGACSESIALKDSSWVGAASRRVRFAGGSASSLVVALHLLLRAGDFFFVSGTMSCGFVKSQGTTDSSRVFLRRGGAICGVFI